MKTFEEKYTAWLDGTLTGEPLQSFENEHPSIQPEKTDYLKLKNLLRENLPGRELENAEFFASQIMEQIKRETAAAGKSSGRRWFGLPRLAWGGIGALGVGFALFFTMIPRGDFSDPRAKYVAEVLKTRTSNPKIKATVENQKEMTIIKLEGLDKLPPGQDLRR
ncbi:MAG: hypothetical protein QOG92_2650 [Verrucomicrobiota bacterium]|jgi:hypothetical protein|nr:hypothetical protein [Verrucomicrobiota bacterium]